MADLALTDVMKTYGRGQVALDRVSLDVQDREFVVIVGPSGCGKSTTLRVIAGIEEETSGDIRIGGAVVNDLCPGARDVAMVFQDYALYPHMTVAGNIGFGLRRRGMARAKVHERVKRVAEVLEITDLLDRRPAMLSGGQRQRVAMGRAMVRRPKVFLFDEPLSNLDARLRVSMRSEMRRLKEHMPTTTVYVTHDQTEAMTMADRVVVMNSGRIEQVGPPMEIYRHPANLFVAQFIGSPAMNLLDATLTETGAEIAGKTHIALSGARDVGRQIVLGFRPEAVRPADSGMPARVRTLEPIGQEIIVEFESAAGTRISSRLPPDTQLKAGENVHLTVDSACAHVFDPRTGAALDSSA
ncbi:MAG: sn-glycerol-3-phosphate ABC transporter ATP-binding protein UgpC [Alphaproteobacteria bacterium]|jgi:ABC-type sugar transport system ATPase subunit|nr:sn-glycerol-3-phosphate ABC transporter ATP-binding protein UgpC [Alphaproteobacteria bacterium]